MAAIRKDGTMRTDRIGLGLPAACSAASAELGWKP
jgi:hypothetical protein